MPLFLVRHAKAGSRSGWVGDDELRPLSRNGRVQADAIAARLAEYPISRILSSPSVRCVETVQPLATKLGLTVEAVEVLAEGHRARLVIDFLCAQPDHAVACTHGDVVSAAIDALVRRGMAVDGEPEWRKGCIWVLEREGDDFIRAQAWPPPA
jgi:phosphohistidine phosphatase SixA